MIHNPAPNPTEAASAATILDRAERRRLALAQMYEGVAPGILRSREAFMRDLPALLQNPKFDRWSIAYHGDARIAFSSSQKEVIRECLKRGLKRDEIFIGMVVPYDDEAEFLEDLA